MKTFSPSPPSLELEAATKHSTQMQQENKILIISLQLNTTLLEIYISNINELKNTNTVVNKILINFIEK